MKFYHLIAPALAVAGSAYWLNNQNETIQELTEKTRIIKERVVVVEKATTEAAVSLGSAKNKSQDEFTLPDGSLDWKVIAEMMSEMRGANGMPTNMKAMLKLQGKMMELTEEEIVDGLEKISALDLEPESVEMIKQGLLSQLAEKNPLLALETLGDPITNRSSSLFWTQSHIISKAAKEDPAKTIAWIDKNIAEGKLQSSSLNQHQDPRLVLESTLINQLVSSDYDAAKSRLEGFTVKEKIHILTTNNHELKGEVALNFIKLARESLPPDKVSETISNAIGSQYHAKLSDISNTLKDLPLNEEEKTNVAENLISNYSRNNNSKDKIQEIYQWSKTEIPGQEVAIVSNAIVEGNNAWQDPQGRFEEAIAASESLGEPEILISFVSEFSSNGNESKVERQLKKFKDPTLAEQYRSLTEALTQDITESE